jgi:hypothetical protein
MQTLFEGLFGLLGAILTLALCIIILGIPVAIIGGAFYALFLLVQQPVWWIGITCFTLVYCLCNRFILEK